MKHKQGEVSLPHLNIAVGIAAMFAPALHSLTDVMEWYHGGFFTIQLWLNYIAFLPMPWLLLGIYTAHKQRPNAVGLGGHFSMAWRLCTSPIQRCTHWQIKFSSTKLCGPALERSTLSMAR